MVSAMGYRFSPRSELNVEYFWIAMALARGWLRTSRQAGKSWTERVGYCAKIGVNALYDLNVQTREASRMSEDELPRVQPVLACSFCHRKKKDVSRLFEHSSGLSICDVCVWLCLDIVNAGIDLQASPPPPISSEPSIPEEVSTCAPSPDVAPECSFCTKSCREVTKLIAGPGVNICDVCVDHFAKGLRHDSTPS